jgi:hypothetical protein
MKKNLLLQLSVAAFIVSSPLSIHAKTNLDDIELVTDSYTFEEISSLDLSGQVNSRIESNSYTSCYLGHKSQQEIKDIFARASKRLLNVNNFENIISLPGQDFILHDGSGNKITRNAKIGDLIKIKLPMDPTLRSYWVKIEQVIQIPNQLKIIVRPTANPKLSKKKGVTDHFFTNAATNTFSVTNTGDKLVARVHGLNEEVNSSQARSWADAAANATIATMAWGFYRDGKAVMGLQSYTWKSLTEHLADCN